MPLYYMKNFYEEMPSEMIDKLPNPNEDKHHIRLPFRMAVSAPSGSGKTNFVLNLIQAFSSGEGTFNDITIITQNKDEPLYNYLRKKAPEIQIKEGLHSIPQLDKMNKKLNHLVVFDDCVLEKDQTPIIKYYIRCRKLGCSVVYLSQSYFDIPSLIRKNCSYMVMLKLGGLREVKDILRQFSLGISKTQLVGMYNYATEEKLSCFLIDVEEKDDEKKFRKGLEEFLDPIQFGSPDDD
jgi:hypothetical protein